MRNLLEDTKMTTKFTKREQAKLKVVFAKLRAQSRAVHPEYRQVLAKSDSPYNSGHFGCGNCGDLSAFYSTLSWIEREVGLSE